MSPQEQELKDFLDAVYLHSQTLIEQFRDLIKKLETTKYDEPTWEELYDQKTLHRCQFDVGSILDDIATVNTRLNYLRGEFKYSKLEYPNVNFPHKYSFQNTIDKQLDALKDYEKSLKSMEAIWERRYKRLTTVTFQQGLETRHRAMS